MLPIQPRKPPFEPRPLPGPAQGIAAQSTDLSPTHHFLRRCGEQLPPPPPPLNRRPYGIRFVRDPLLGDWTGTRRETGGIFHPPRSIGPFGRLFIRIFRLFPSVGFNEFITRIVCFIVRCEGSFSIDGRSSINFEFRLD